MPARSSLRRLLRLAATGSSASRELTRYRAFLRQDGHYPGAFFNLTVDFELAWSRARRGDGSTTGAEALERSRRARANLPALLRLCEEFGLPLTFAVVGHVALRECGHRDPPAFAPSWAGGDWYAVDPRQSLDVDGDHYGADLVQAIRESPVGHELASHGFSHVDLGDDETTAEVARFELDESYRILSRLDPQLSTLVFPKNHTSFLELVRDAGYTIYRADRNAVLARDELGLWRFPLGVWLSPEAATADEFVGAVREAIGAHHLMNCYFHLYEFTDGDELERFFAPIFRFLQREAAEGHVRTATMRGIVDAVAQG